MKRSPPYKKGTLLIPSGPTDDPDRLHLFVICTDECPNGYFLIVPISTLINNLCDTTCVLQEYEHQFLKHQSYALYRFSRIEHRNTITNGINQSAFKIMDDMNGQTFARVRNGICKSPHTPRRIRVYAGCNDQNSS